ncbi:hypothetical protein LTR94_035778, partial [Friedmanniomyces endolithicus]
TAPSRSPTCWASMGSTRCATSSGCPSRAAIISPTRPRAFRPRPIACTRRPSTARRTRLDSATGSAGWVTARACTRWRTLSSTRPSSASWPARRRPMPTSSPCSMRTCST